MLTTTNPSRASAVPLMSAGGAFFKASAVDEGKDGQPVNRNSARRRVYVQFTVLAPGGSVVEQTGDGAVGHDAWRGHVFRLTIGVADWYA